MRKKLLLLLLTVVISAMVQATTNIHVATRHTEQVFIDVFGYKDGVSHVVELKCNKS